MPDGRSPMHPRPLLCREEWTCLDGEWQFAIDAKARWRGPDEVEWDRTIRVPFSPETEASGVHQPGFYNSCWYRRTIAVSPPANGDRLHLHFGAVDYAATVWANGQLLVRHEGGYTPFTADLTPHAAGGAIVVVVRAEDDPHDLAKPRGKQDWQLEPHSIWYPRTSGIWQPVWLEVVPALSISRVHWTPTLERYEVGVEVRVEGAPKHGTRLRVVLKSGPILLADDTYGVISGEVHRRIALSDPGIEDYRNELLWSPESPNLIRAQLQLLDGDAIVDEVKSYTALRSVAVQGDRFVLNGRPLGLRLVLDQGYWPGTGQTAPDDAALRRDVELAKAMGFNGVRKHQKIEDPRYLYWADVLGLLVWEEMPSAYRFTTSSVERMTREWTEVIERDRDHPCIVAWVPFNESWGVPDLPDSPTQRHYVQALYHLTKTLDPTRPVVGNDGWESVATDVIGIHDYDDQLVRIARRYGAEESLRQLYRRERPGGRILILGGDPESLAGHPVVLTEFGGIAYSPEEGTWGYSRAGTAEGFADKYARLLRVIRSLPVLAGFCYTQFADTYQEANGLLYADRTPKFPLTDRARGSPSTSRSPTTRKSGPSRSARWRRAGSAAGCRCPTWRR